MVSRLDTFPASRTSDKRSSGSQSSSCYLDYCIVKKKKEKKRSHFPPMTAHRDLNTVSTPPRNVTFKIVHLKFINQH